jgi:hypothetical protein
MDGRQYDPSGYLQQQPVADGRQLPSGMRYDEQQFGVGVDPQRNMTPGLPSTDISQRRAEFDGVSIGSSKGRGVSDILSE